jgi:ribosomal protein L37E
MTQTKKRRKETMNETAKCPRCGRPGPQPPDLGMLSRYDNETVVCRTCGMHEALVQADVGTDALHPVTGLRRWVAWQ